MSIHDPSKWQYLSNIGSPHDASSDGVNLYFSDYVSVCRLAPGVAVGEVLFNFADHGISPNAIAVNGNTIFVATSNKVYRSNLDAVSFELVVDNPNGWIADLVTDGVDLFWADEETGIYRAPFAGGPRVQVVSRIGAMAITCHGGDLYWVEDGSEQVRRVGKDGSGEALVLGLDAAFGSTNYVPGTICIAANRIWIWDPGARLMASCRLDGSAAEVVKPNMSTRLWVFPNTEAGEGAVGEITVRKIERKGESMGISWNAQTGMSYEILSSVDLSFGGLPEQSIQDFKVNMTVSPGAEREFFLIRESVATP